MASQREALFAFAKETFGTEPEFLWEKTPDAGVLRHADNRKWYGIVMTVQRKTLGLSGEGAVEILNVKADYLTGSFLRQQAGFLPAYHMNKEHWNTIIVDGNVDETLVKELIEQSYQLTK